MKEALVTFILVFFVVYLLTHWNWGKRDDTDSATERSGLVLYTDHGTGVQYVGTPFGAVTPRLGKDGKPIIAPEPPK